MQFNRFNYEFYNPLCLLMFVLIKFYISQRHMFNNKDIVTFSNISVKESELIVLLLKHT